MAYDANANCLYAGGSFKGNISLSYGSSFTASYGNLDGFLAKYDLSGNVIWAIKIGGINDDEIHGIATDGSGNIYVTGYFNGTADFDPSTSTYTLSSSGGQDGFLAKYSSLGNFLWATKFSGTGNEDSWKLYADANGIYLSGSYQAQATFYSYSSIVTKSTSVTAMQDNAFGAKYNASGVVQWVVSLAGNKDDNGYAAVADANNVYFLGHYENDIVIEDASGSTSTLQAQQTNKAQVYITSFTQSGSFNWQNNITNNAGGDTVWAYGFVQDAANLYVSGSFNGNINFKYPSPAFTQSLSAGGMHDLYLTKISKTGTFSWVTSATGNGIGDQLGRALALDASGNVILGGSFTTLLDYSAAGGSSFTAVGDHDVFVTAYSNSGSFLWSTTAGGVFRDYLNGISVDNYGNIYLGGVENGGMIVGTTTLTSGGGDNVFVAKLGCPTLTGNAISSSQTVCAGAAPFTFTGSIFSTGVNYIWQYSNDNTTWLSAGGTYTMQNYAASTLTTNTYYRRVIFASGNCSLSASASNTILVSVDHPPSSAVAGLNQTVCVNSTSISATVPSLGTGSWSVISGSSTLSSPGSFSSTVSGLSVGTNNFQWTVSNGVCPASSATLSIFRQIPPSVNAGISQTVCSSTATLGATIPTAGIGTWSLTSGSGTISNIYNASTAITSLGIGMNQFVWTISYGVCPPGTATVSVIRDQQPTADAGVSQTVCSSTSILAAVNPTIGAGVWSVLSGSASVTGSNVSYSEVYALSAGVNQFLWTVTNGVCAPATSTVNIFRDLDPTSNAGINQTLCSSVATLAAVNPTIGSGTWSVLSGGGSVLAANNPSSVVTALGIGTNQFVWTVTNGSCPPAADTLVIITDAQPGSFAGLSQNVCASSATLGATIPTVGAGVWSVISGTAGVSSFTNPASPVTSLSTGTTILAWTVNNGVCPAAVSTVAVIRDIQATANAGLSQTICSSGATLAAVIPTVGSGMWSVSSGSASILSPNNPTASITGLATGTNVFVWSVTNGVCPVATSTVAIIRSSPLTADAGTSQSVCSSGATLAAATPTSGSGSWTTIVGSASINSSTNAASSVSGLDQGLNTFLWTVSSSVCPSATALVNVWRDTQPTANAGSNQNICSATTTLNANTPTVGTGLWSIASGTASSSNFSTPFATLTSVGAGTNIFLWTVTNGVCPPATSSLTIVRDLPPSALAGTDQTLCSSNATLNATAPAVGSGMWTLISGTAAIASFTDPVSTVTGLGTGTTALLWTVNNGSCPSATAIVNLIQDIAPSANAGSNQTLCATSATLSANLPTVGTGLWSVVTGSGSVVSGSSASTMVNSLSTGTNVFLWTVSNGVCPPASASVTIVRDANPGVVSVCNDFTVCTRACTLSATSATPGNGNWLVLTGNGSLTTFTNPNSNVTGLSPGINQFIWTNSNGICPPSLDTVTVYFTQPLSPADAGPDQRVCSSQCTLAANNNGYGTWSLLVGNAILSDSSNANSQVASLAAGTTTLVWTVTKNFCPSSEDTVIIYRDEEPSVANAGSDQRICGPSASLSAINPLKGSGSWNVIQGGGILSGTVAQTSVSGLSPGNNSFIWTVSSGVCSSSYDTLKIFSDEKPSVAFAGSDRMVCKDDIILDARQPEIGTGFWSLISGTCTILQPSLNTSPASGLKEGIHLLKWTVSNGVCTESADTLKIQRTFTPIAPDAGNDQDLETSTSQLSANIPQSGTGTWSILAGNCDISDIHDKHALISALPFGNTILRWTIANEACPDVWDDINVHVKSLNIPNAFSPNGDGINDKFVITSLAYYNGAKLSVFNRWGTLVFNSNNYQNNWDGTSIDHEQLADDTYYVILEISGYKNITGFVIIKRDQ